MNKMKNKKQIDEYMDKCYNNEIKISSEDFKIILEELKKYYVCFKIKTFSVYGNFFYYQFFIIDYKNRTLARLYEKDLYIAVSWEKDKITYDIIKIVYSWTNEQKLLSFYPLYQSLKIIFEE